MPIFRLSELKPADQVNSSSREFEQLIAKLGDTKHDYKTGTYTRSMIPTHSDIEPTAESAGYQQNYMGYLTRCWADHLGVVIEPNHIWYTLLCELAVRVKNDPEHYRSLFTESENKQTIVVMYDGSYIMDLKRLVTAMEAYVPTDTAAFFPEFSTNSRRSLAAKYAAFADMASPFYDYMMLACGFPAIDVRGTLADWALMLSKWENLAKLFGAESAWVARVLTILVFCVDNFNDPRWWQGIYTNKRCGSGSQVEISGWFSDLFYEKCKLPKPENFPACVSTVNYTVVANGVTRAFRMKQGLFTSKRQDEFLVPDFGYVLYNVADARFGFEPEKHPDEIVDYGHCTTLASARPMHRLEPENMVCSQKSSAPGDPTC